jgi:hypothetical protein
LATFCAVCAVTAACSTSAPGADRTYDACSPIAVTSPTASAAQLASLSQAMQLWAGVGVEGFSVAGSGAPLAMAFVDGTPAEYGLYDGADETIYINAAALDDAELPIVMAHELGHAVGLVHVPMADRVSVMNPGNLAALPTAADADAVAALWGCD